MAIYVSGFVCQDTIREAGTDLFSALRIADKLNVNIPIGIDPASLPQTTANILILYRSEQPESFSSTVRVIEADGVERPPQVFSLATKGGTNGHMIHLMLLLQPSKMGLMWIEVSVRDELRLRIPFEVTHMQPSGSQPDQPQIGV